MAAFSEATWSGERLLLERSRRNAQIGGSRPNFGRLICSSVRVKLDQLISELAHCVAAFWAALFTLVIAYQRDTASGAMPLAHAV